MAHILDDLDLETEEKQTNPVEHIDLVSYADLVDHRDIFFMINEPFTTILEEQIESMMTEQFEFQIVQVVSHPERRSKIATY